MGGGGVEGWGLEGGCGVGGLVVVDVVFGVGGSAESADFCHWHRVLAVLLCSFYLG